MIREHYWKHALDQSEKALKSGALIPLPTEILTEVDDNQFVIRKLIGELPIRQKAVGPVVNPFLPWDLRLQISMINDSHGLILNKYPVQKGHMLLVTRNWEPQNGWLDINDFRSLITVDNDTTGLWFFNSSSNAGASQPHRHLQLLRRKKGSISCPRDDWFKSISTTSNRTNKISKSCFVKRREKSTNNSLELFEQYLSLCLESNVGIPNKNIKPVIAYNLLICRDWICLVRRKKEICNGFSINALGFAGYILATSKSDMDILIKRGVENLLSEVVDPI